MKYGVVSLQTETIMLPGTDVRYRRIVVAGSLCAGDR